MLFGTDGIRGEWGVGVLREESVIQIGKALAAWSLQKHARSRILIVTDTRESCALMKACLKVGLLSFPVDIIDAGVAPTSLAYYALSFYDCDYAVVISASHNPYYDNGIKLFDRQQRKLSSADENALTALIHSSISSPGIYGTDTHLTGIIDVYTDLINRYFKHDFIKDFTVVLDCAHGAMSAFAPQLFSLYGAQVIPLNNHPNGRNINHSVGALYPEILQKAVIENNADIGFAFDGDGDRVIACSRNGTIKDGDDILALLSMMPEYAQHSLVVGTILSNYGFEYFLQQHKKSLIRADVGDKNVLAKMLQEHVDCGGEPSGHIMLKDFDYVGDGILVAFKIMDAIIKTGNRDFVTFDKCPQVSINVPAVQKKDLTSEPFAQLLHDAKTMVEQGRIVVRFSGTEPLLRIMVEAMDKDKALAIGGILAKQLSALLGASGI